MKRLTLCLVILLFPLVLLAGTYYAAPKGSIANDAAASGSGTLGDPWSIGRAMANAVADDTVYFRGGTYYTSYDGIVEWQKPGFYPANSGTAGHYITFIAYTGETPIISSTTNSQTALCYGPYACNYIIFDGFESYGTQGAQITAGGIRVGSNGVAPGFTKGVPSTYTDSVGCIIRNAVAHGGDYICADQDNACLLRIESATDLLVQNCKFYFYTVSDWITHDNFSNHTAIEVYYSTNVIIENCEIYNTPDPFYNKTGAGPYITYRYNYVHDNYLAFYNESGIYNRSYTIVHDNVFINCGDSTTLDIEQPQTPADSDYFSFYNNTVYMNAAHSCVGIDRAHYLDVYNNILINLNTSSDGYILWTNDSSGNTISTWDHNNYGAYCQRFMRDAGTVYTTLAAWQASTALIGGAHPGTGDLRTATADIFVNGSGNLNTLADFEVKGASLTAGRSGGRMGADVSLVGIDAGSSTPTAPTSVPTIGVGGFRTW